MCKKSKKQKNKEEDTMAAITNNYNYNVKIKKSQEKKIPVFGKSKYKECKDMLSKYSQK